MCAHSTMDATMDDRREYRSVPGLGTVDRVSIRDSDRGRALVCYNRISIREFRLSSIGKKSF